MNRYCHVMIIHRESKTEALKTLEGKPLSCVTWNEKGVVMSAIYWNGKRRVQKAETKINWSIKE